MGRASPFFVKIVTLQGEGNNGERLPILLDRSTNTPVTIPMEWALSVRRAAPVSWSTMDRELRSLGHFEAWLRKERLSLHDPVSFVDAFKPNKIETSLRPWLGIDTSDRKVKKLSVSNEVIYDRIVTIRTFLKWVLKNVERSFSVRTEAPQIIAFKSARESIESSLTDIIPTQFGNEEVIGLTASQVNKLLEIVDPQSPYNPWARGNSEKAEAIRTRNEVIVLLLLAFGPRRGELLKLHTGDVKTHGAEPTLWVRRRPDDPNDTRKYEPNSKTQERMLPLDPYVSRKLNDYVGKYRRLIPNYKKTPYLFLSSKNGRPLSTRSFDEIFEGLYDLPFDIYPHLLRHTHNDKLKAICKKKNLADKDYLDHAKYLNGWLGDNTGRYTKREAREAAHEISKAVQSQLFSPLEDLPF
jgi:integrase